jgi:precorrin-6B methylase 2
MPIDKLASEIFREFKAKSESQHIASEFSLRELSRFVARIKPQRILEIGAGIGTITKLLLTHPDRPTLLTSTEAHPVCLTELSKNLQGVKIKGYTLLETASQLDLMQHYDLVIFDGTLDDEKQYGVLKSGTWCFVDGSRNRTIDALQKKLLKRGMNIVFENRRPDEKKLRLYLARSIFGLRFPALRMKSRKGCSIGQVSGEEVVSPA